MKFAMVLTFVTLSLTLVNCGTKNNNMDQNMQEIRRVFQEDKAKIIKEYGASGAGIGKRDELIVIVVYVDPKTLAKPLDTHWKDIPLVYEDIGEVRAQ